MITNRNIIKENRISKGYTQEEISKMLNITLRNYQYIEHSKSKPNIITALKLCKILSLNPFEVWNIN